MKDTKFKRGDYVRVVKGFERGIEGRVKGHSSSWGSTSNRYGISGIEIYFDEDEIEAATPPLRWWEKIDWLRIAWDASLAGIIYAIGYVAGRR